MKRKVVFNGWQLVATVAITAGVLFAIAGLWEEAQFSLLVVIFAKLASIECRLIVMMHEGEEDE